MNMRDMETPHATTILSVRREGVVAIGGDGQVTIGNQIMKLRIGRSNIRRFL